MLKKALKKTAPFAAGIVAGFLFAVLVFGVQAAVKTIIPVVIGVAVAFVANLYFAGEKKQ